MQGRPYLYVASAHSDESLDKLVAHRRAVLARAGHELRLRDLCHTTGTLQLHAGARIGVVARSVDDLAAQLGGVAAGDPSPTVIRGRAGARRCKLVFVFPGVGSQWLGMARALIAEEPVFRTTIERCDDALREPLGWSVLGQLLAEPDASRLDEIDVSQPTVFSVQVALVALLRTWGILPDAVIGHSQGELTAAHIAGVLSLQEAARIVGLRSHGLAQPCARGGMAVIGLPHAEVEELIAPWRDRVWVSIHESLESTAISGEPAALDAIVAAALARDVFARRARLPCAPHCPVLDPLREAMLEQMSSIRPQPAEVPLLSTVDPGVDARAAGALGPMHWWNNIRLPVLFAEAIHRAVSEGYNTFLEISPHPVLCQGVSQYARQAGVSIAALPTMRRDADDRAALLSGLGALYTRGREIDWAAICDGTAGLIQLPHDHPMLDHHVEVLDAEVLDVGVLEGEVPDTDHVGNGSSGDAQAAGNGHHQILVDLHDVADAERQPRIEALLVLQLAKVLGRPAARVDAGIGLCQVGLDSLLALELRNRIRAELGIAPPLARLVMSEVSLRELARDLLDQLVARPQVLSCPAASPGGSVASGLGIDDLSEDQILALMQELDDNG